MAVCLNCIQYLLCCCLDIFPTLLVLKWLHIDFIFHRGTTACVYKASLIMFFKDGRMQFMRIKI